MNTKTVCQNLQALAEAELWELMLERKKVRPTAEDSKLRNQRMSVGVEWCTLSNTRWWWGLYRLGKFIKTHLIIHTTWVNFMAYIRYAIIKEVFFYFFQCMEKWLGRNSPKSVIILEWQEYKQFFLFSPYFYNKIIFKIKKSLGFHFLHTLETALNVWKDSSDSHLV